MPLAQLKAQLPQSARDLRKNLAVIEKDQTLAADAKWAVILSCAIASECGPLIAAAKAAGSADLTRRNEELALAAATMMALSRVYGRLGRLDGRSDYVMMPPGLQMDALDAPSGDMTLFELCCLGALAVSGSACDMRGHEIVLRHRGVSKEGIHAVVRYAAVMKAAAVTLTGALALSSRDHGELPIGQRSLRGP